MPYDASTLFEELATPEELSLDLPITFCQKDFIKRSRQTIHEILDRKDPRHLLIMGPCSIHDMQSAKEYARRLKKLSEVVSDTFFPVMRVYFEKPRTSVGWKGFLYDPHVDGSHDLQSGLRLTRQLLLALADMEVPAAAEFLDPATALYFGDLISWGSIGARTSASQVHRQIASSLSIPMGIKNSIDGNIDVAIYGILSALEPHSFMGINRQGKGCLIRSKGNPDCHLILRGGEEGVNYDAESVYIALQRLKALKLPPRLIIDCSHDNARKNGEDQDLVFRDVMQQIASGNQGIIGIMLESHLRKGNQSSYRGIKELEYGISITDPCLDWESTEELVLWGKTLLKGNHSDVKGLSFAPLASSFAAALMIGGGMLGATGCAADRINAYTRYLTVDDLASTQVLTPDPRKHCPDIGQQLVISWTLSSQDFCLGETQLIVKIRFRNLEEDEIVVPLYESSGTYIYHLLNDDYFDRNGIQTYKIDLISNGEVMEEWRHQIWTDLILFKED